MSTLPTTLREFADDERSTESMTRLLWGAADRIEALEKANSILLEGMTDRMDEIACLQARVEELEEDIIETDIEV